VLLANVLALHFQLHLVLDLARIEEVSGWSGVGFLPGCRLYCLLCLWGDFSFLFLKKEYRWINRLGDELNNQGSRKDFFKF